METLAQKEKKFDQKVDDWAITYKDDRKKYWGEDWSDKEYWTYWEGQEKKYFTCKQKMKYCFDPIYDGTINAIKYQQSKYKILIIAKEPHDPEGYNISYRQDLKIENEPDKQNEGFKNNPKFWDPAQKVSYGIFNGVTNYSATKINGYNDLQSTAFINVQKFRARGSTNSGTLNDWYLNHGCKELLDVQLEILKPEIIICLYTCDIIWKSIDKIYDMEPDKYKKKFYNAFAKQQRLNEEAVTSAYFKKDILCVDCFHLSMPCLNPDVWVQGILTAFSDWQKYRGA
jgi:hypothetical protein